MKNYCIHCLLVISLILAVILAGCNLPSNGKPITTPTNPTPAPDQPTSSPAAHITPANTIQPARSGDCANPYFPTNPGATWTYANTSQMAPNSTTTRTLSGITPTGFMVKDAITPDITMNIQWGCKAGNLSMLQSATITMSSDKSVIGITSVDSTGYLIPPVISAGNTWSESLKILGSGAIDGTTKMIQHNDTEIACTANGKESVQVQAGKFEAFKVTCVYNISTLTEVEGETTPAKPVSVTIQIADWYVAGVGSVKTEKTGDIVETKEMTSYSIH